MPARRGRVAPDAHLAAVGVGISLSAPATGVATVRTGSPTGARQQQGDESMKNPPAPDRRAFLMSAAGTGLAALSGVAAAQSFEFKPNQRYPDPAVQILDPAFARYRIYSSTARAGRDRHALGRGAGLLPRGRLPAGQRHPEQPDHEIQREGRQLHRLPQPGQLRQRQHPRPPGPARHLRALGHAAHHPDREGRQGHGPGRQLRGQAAERAERHRRQVGRQHLVHRPDLRHQRRVGRLARQAGAGDDQRLPHRQRRQDHRRAHRPRQPERPGVLARREEALRRRVEGHAQPQHLELRRRRRRHRRSATRPS